MPSVWHVRLRSQSEWTMLVMSGGEFMGLTMLSPTQQVPATNRQDAVCDVWWIDTWACFLRVTCERLIGICTCSYIKFSLPDWDQIRSS